MFELNDSARTMFTPTMFSRRRNCAVRFGSVRFALSRITTHTYSYINIHVTLCIYIYIYIYTCLLQPCLHAAGPGGGRIPAINNNSYY